MESKFSPRVTKATCVALECRNRAGTAATDKPHGTSGGIFASGSEVHRDQRVAARGLVGGGKRQTHLGLRQGRSVELGGRSGSDLSQIYIKKCGNPTVAGGFSIPHTHVWKDAHWGILNNRSTC